MHHVCDVHLNYASEFTWAAAATFAPTLAVGVGKGEAPQPPP